MIRAEKPSRYAAERCLLDIRCALEAMRNGSTARMESVAWPAGLDRTVLHALPLEVRTRNCLQRERLMEGDNPLTVQELLRVPNFGRQSLRDLLFTVEDFLNECVRIGSADSREAGGPNERTPTVPNEATEPMKRAEAPRTPWDRAGQLLSPLLAAAAELHGAKTVADALNPEFMHLAGRMGIAGAIGAVGIDHLAKGTPGLVSATLSLLVRTLDTASDTERTIIEHRLLRTPPTTLEAVGSQVGVTRERIRQVQARIERKIHAALGRGLRIIAATLKEPFGHVVSQSQLEDRIEELLPADESLATRLYRRALLNEMGFTLNNGMYLDERATEQLKHIRASIRRHADDVGLVDEQRLVASLPSEEWERWWPWVRERCGLHELFGSFGIRDSGKARAKAALISIGRPATREEIARMCGFGENKTGSHLSVIPSVVKADKDRWGLKDWVDDEYEGIVSEIIQRIEEDGGAHHYREVADGAARQVQCESGERARLHADAEVRDPGRMDQPGEHVIGSAQRSGRRHRRTRPRRCPLLDLRRGEPILRRIQRHRRPARVREGARVRTGRRRARPNRQPARLRRAVDQMAPRLDDRRIARVSRRAARAPGPGAWPARTGDHQGTLPRRAERRRREFRGVSDE